MISKGNEYTAALEPGYTWITKSGFTMNLGLLLGETYFTANDETAGWRNHYQLKNVELAMNNSETNCFNYRSL
jgi:hypothetical protein